MDQRDYLSASHPEAIEQLYHQYIQDKNTVDETWARFFDGFDFAIAHFPAKADSGAKPHAGQASSEHISKEFRVINLINGYRARGHLFTRTNPVRERRKYLPTLDIENFQLQASDLDTVFQAGELIGIGPAKLSAIIDHLKQTYCESIGVEYMYIRNQEVVDWLQKTLESSKGHANYSPEEQHYIFDKLSEAVILESFLDKKFVGQKRFSLEGCESLIPALHTLINEGSKLGVEEVVMGMAHRGRINVLANIFQKDPSNIFNEFEGKEYEEDEDGEFSGDVKYHLGYHTGIETRSGKKVQLTLAPNPSHLEAVAPVVQGLTRAFAERNHHSDFNKIVPVLIHGDAAIAGQGVVYEVIQMAKLDGYKTGGTIHIVTNNQVGFTTNYIDGRSSIYCTDVGKVTLSPVFHVNADDVEAVTYAMELAVAFRQRFNGDVFIDLLGYRKYGHNEGDEPRFTQPILYKTIAKHPNPRKIYLDRLLHAQRITQAMADKQEESFKAKLESELEKSKGMDYAVIRSFLEEKWQGIKKANAQDFETPVNTRVALASLKKVAKALYSIPEGQKFFKKMEKLLNDRREMVEIHNRLDWGMAELLAYGSLLIEGHKVRFSGQDVERGTFSHRHAILKIEDSEEEYTPLNNISPDQARFDIFNSLLSEYAVLGFDYGYSLAFPDWLSIWEAQFGDFNNGAQIIIDQFISAGEDKWRSMSGVVLLLPHGYEGQGSEHSSARLERFLTLCAENNMIVVNCTTPANQFHVLRRQLKASFRKPLICFTPKSLLRHALCTSTMEELAEGEFLPIIDDMQANAENVEKLVFCSGKVYYDLLDAREKADAHSQVALVRIEQLYPFPEGMFNRILDKYKHTSDLYWVQEEPENMGAWNYLLRTKRNIPFKLISRSASGSPATGSSKRHQIEQKAIVDALFQPQTVQS